VISRTGEAVERTGDRKMLVRKSRATVAANADRPILRLPATGERLFNFVPGLEAIPLAFDGGSAALELTVY
jgi:hypothetical protein